MRHFPHSTIEQWAVLRTVIEQGSFALASIELNRSQSSVSYAIAKLQETLGVKLLESQGRRAVLTQAGAALLAEVVPLIDELARLEERTHAIAGGEAVRIRLLVDSLFPKTRLFDALEHFVKQHPHVEVHVRETVRLSISEAREEAFDLAVLVAEPGASLVDLISYTALTAVAHANHPLARDARLLGKAKLARHARVEIRGMETMAGPLVNEGKIWQMNTVESAIEAVRRGLCYGWLPRHLIENELQQGILLPLELEAGSTRHIPLGLCFGQDGAEIEPSVSALASLLALKEVEAGACMGGNAGNFPLCQLP